MHFRYTIYFVPLAISAAVVFAIMVYGFFHRKTRGAAELIASAAAGLIWVTANALEMAGTDLSTKLFWANVEYFAYAFSPFCWLAMVLRIQGKDHYLTAKNLVLVSIIPVVTSVLVWFDPVLGLVRHSFSLDSSGEYSVIVKKYGPWFWLHYSYSYAFNLISIIELVRAVRKKGSIHRFQALILLIGLGLIFLSNLSYVARLSPMKRNDFTPVMFGLSAAILWFGIFRYRIFEIIPIARTTIFERMANGILVIDAERNLIDCNEAARKMFALGGTRLVDKNIGNTIPALTAALDEFVAADDGREGGDSFQKEIRLESPSGSRFLELSASRLRDPRYETAWVIIVTDITDLKQARERIVRQFQELAAAEERERLSRELHDNLGQVLSFSVIQSDAIQRELRSERKEAAETHLTRLREILKGAHGDLRDLVHGIRDAGYASLTIGALLEREADAFHHSCDLEAVVVTSAESRAVDLSAFQKNHLARILKEALNNIAKHACASKVVIRFDYSLGVCELSIEDDGIGLPPDSDPLKGGSGLGIMGERASCIGGTLEIGNTERGGTKVRLVFPVQAEKQNENIDR